MKCSVELQPAVTRGVDGLQLDFELAGGEDAFHPLLAEDEGVAEGAGAAEVGAVGAEVDAAFAPSQAGVDRDRRRRVGFVADDQGDAVVAGVGGDPGGRVFQHAFFSFGFFGFVGGDFGAELDVFFVFDRAFARFIAFFVFAGRFVGFGGVGFLFGDERQRRQRQAQGLRRAGGSGKRIGTSEVLL